MPTGYTAPVVDGEMTSPADFILNCARAFGALVSLRDSPRAPIPDELQPSTYHAEQAEAAQARLDDLLTTDAGEAEAEARRAHDAAMGRWRDGRAKTDRVLGRLTEMRAAIVEWTPPTPDHEGLKEFMLDQLDQTIRYDGTFDTPAPEFVPGPERLAARIAAAEWDIEYHTAEQERENERVAERNAWLAALRASLPTASHA